MAATKETVDLFVELPKGFLESACVYAWRNEMREEGERKRKRERENSDLLNISSAACENFYATMNFRISRYLVIQP